MRKLKFRSSKMFNLAMFAMLLGGMSGLQAQETTYENAKKAMTEGYWKVWNADVQSKIDSDIEKFRKATAEVNISNAEQRTIVHVEQISHDFVF